GGMRGGGGDPPIVEGLLEDVVVGLTVVVGLHDRGSSSSSSQSPLIFQHAKEAGFNPFGVLLSKAVCAGGAQNLRQDEHGAFRQERWHFGSAPVARPQLLLQSA